MKRSPPGAGVPEDHILQPLPSVTRAQNVVGAFLLSPASTSGRRAEILLRDGASFPLALRVRSSEGAPIGEVFSFLSGLYFRGKATYARAFAPSGRTFVITPDRGLLPVDTPVTASTLRAFASVDVHAEEARFTEPLARDAEAVARALDAANRVVLLGSIASQ
ncbi:MAG: hypothetical protein M3O50_05730, partial [Myxococcota bacterium]|nr:hypothetical protein [Myxococcota bacterium]